VREVKENVPDWVPRKLHQGFCFAVKFVNREVVRRRLVASDAEKYPKFFAKC
jgi:hypothetical protein